MKRILIVGATSAIATACARLWAAKGGQFFLVARDAEKLEQTASDLMARGAKSVTTYEMDATDFSAHSPMIASCIGLMHQIDIALIAHGTLPDQKECEKNVDVALREFTSNGLSVIALLIRLSQQFKIQRCGTIAVISSVAGDRGRPTNYLYGASKSAVSTFCEGLRASLYKVGVHVMDIKPGFVATPMTQGLALPKLLVSAPETIAKLIVGGVKRKMNILYAPGFWAVIMFIIRNIPQTIFKRLNL
jgi:short-subunit dehydrogenase